MKGQKQIFSTGKDEWGTPPAFIDYLKRNVVYGDFDYDLAASKENAVARNYLTESDDFLNPLTSPAPSGIFWLNPPYSKNYEFVKKAYEFSNPLQKVVVLVPARTDTEFWHDYAMKAMEILFIKGRLKFVGAENSAPFPSVLLWFDGLKSSAHHPAMTSIQPTPKERGF